jgi:hypothetical protein
MSDPRLLSAEQLAELRAHPYAGPPAKIMLAHIDAQAERIARLSELVSEREGEFIELDRECDRRFAQLAAEADCHRDALRDAIQCCTRCGLSRRALYDNADGCYDTGPHEYGSGACWYTERQRKADERIAALEAECIEMLAHIDEMTETTDRDIAELQEWGRNAAIERDCLYNEAYAIREECNQWRKRARAWKALAKRQYRATAFSRALDRCQATFAAEQAEQARRVLACPDVGAGVALAKMVLGEERDS